MALDEAKKSDILQQEAILGLNRDLFEVKAGVASVVLGIVDDLLLRPLGWVVPRVVLGRWRAKELRDGDSDDARGESKHDDAAARGSQERQHGEGNTVDFDTHPRKMEETMRETV